MRRPATARRAMRQRTPSVPTGQPISTACCTVRDKHAQELNTLVAKGNGASALRNSRGVTGRCQSLCHRWQEARLGMLWCRSSHRHAAS